MNRYLIRSVKYLVWLTVLFILIFTVMVATGTTRAGDELEITAIFNEIFGSSRGVLMICVILVLAALYPRFGFVNRTVGVRAATAHDDIIKSFDMSGYTLVGEENGSMIFRAATPLKKAMLLYEDQIVVTLAGEIAYIEGIRKEVVKIEFRLKSFAQYEN